MKKLLFKLLGDYCSELNGPRHKLFSERILFAKEYYADKSVQQLLKNQFTNLINKTSTNQLILITDRNPRAVLPKIDEKELCDYSIS